MGRVRGGRAKNATEGRKQRTPNVANPYGWPFNINDLLAARYQAQVQAQAQAQVQQPDPYVAQLSALEQMISMQQQTID